MGFNWMWGTDRIRDAVLGKEADFKTKEVVDPLKQNVASPLSKYLTTQIGQGVPRYDRRITGKFPEGSLESAQNFMNIDPSSYFTESIEQPAINRFREELALSKEDFAGRLSGSGRFRSEEESINRFTRDLAGTRAQFETTLPQQQFEVASRIKQFNDQEAMAQYKDWYKSLPQYSPILDKALSFLNEQSSSGTTVLSALDEGSEGMLGDIIKVITSAVAAAAMA